EESTRRDASCSSDGEEDRGPRRSEVESDAGCSARQACDQGFLPGAVQIRPPDVARTNKIAPIHLAVRKIESNTERARQSREDDLLAGTVQVCPLDAAVIDEVELAARKIQSDALGHRQARQQDLFVGAVEVVAPDGSCATQAFRDIHL